MARVYSHRRGTTQKKAKPIEAMYAAVVSTISAVVYFAVIFYSVSQAGETSKLIGGIGMLGFAVAIGAFAFNVKQMAMDTDLHDRIICISVSTLVLILWIATMIIGMFN